jgi:hypothetical protein
MDRAMRRAGAAVVLVCGLSLALAGAPPEARAQPREVLDAPLEPAPPAGQDYIGFKRCASCHMDQFRSWALTTHAEDAWEIVPKAYRADPACLKCHATGHGHSSGFKTPDATPNLTGTSCEACHGPGSKHQEICKPLMAKKGNHTPDEAKAARDSIWRVHPQNACRACHNSQAHKEHPEFDRGDAPRREKQAADAAAARRRGSYH